MRVKSLSDLGHVDQQTPQAKQLKQALDAYELDVKKLRQSRNKNKTCSNANASTRSSRTKGQRDPQTVLGQFVRFDDYLSRHAWEDDYVGAVPGRKFELDLAVPALKLGVEVDGWAFHGQHKESFLRDRDKDYMLSIEGWVIVRIQAGIIFSDPDEALTRVRRFMSVWEPKQIALLNR